MPAARLPSQAGTSLGATSLPGIAPLRDFAHQSLHGVVDRDDGAWEAQDEDPQFLLTLADERMPAGVYRLVARLHGDAVHRPCVYFDFGAGWSEATCFALHEAPEGGVWSTILALPSFGRCVRFDPSDRAGAFHFGGVTLEWLGSADGEALSLIDNQGAELAVTRDTAAPRSTLPSRRDYARWIARHDTPSIESGRRLAQAVAASPRRPLLSLVMAVDADGDGVHALVGSLLAQSSPDWELLLVHADTAAAERLASLRAQAHRSSRVELLAASSSTGDADRVALGVARARGEFIAVVEAALQLVPHALLAFADAFIRAPESRLAYADEDRIDATGRRYDPYFKSGWDPDLLLTHDQPGPLAFCAAGLLREFFNEHAAAVHTSFARRLWLADRLSVNEVVHIPHVLYHVQGAMPTDAGEASRPALAAHLQQGAPGACVGATYDGALHIQRPVPDAPPLVSIVIPTRDRVDLLGRCVDGILALTTYPRFEIVIVDNQSSQAETLDYLDGVQSDPRVRVLAYDQPFNYSAVNNFAVDDADGEVIVLLNNDVEIITPGWLEEMLQYASRPDVGAVGAMLYYPDDTIQHAGVVLGLGGVAGHAYLHQPRGYAGQRGRVRHVQRVGAVTAACLMVRRDAYRQVGGLDESLAVAFNDVDFCLRLAAAGLSSIWTPFAELYHYESASRGSEDTPEKQARFASEVRTMLTRWSTAPLADPSYHPNLSLALDSAYALADPPRAPLDGWIASVIARDGRAGVQP